LIKLSFLCPDNVRKISVASYMWFLDMILGCQRIEWSSARCQCDIWASIPLGSLESWSSANPCTACIPSVTSAHLFPRILTVFPVTTFHAELVAFQAQYSIHHPKHDASCPTPCLCLLLSDPSPHCADLDPTHLLTLYPTNGAFSKNASHCPESKKQRVRKACAIISGKTNWVISSIS
jgi:hypothetical protein